MSNCATRFILDFGYCRVLVLRPLLRRSRRHNDLVIAPQIVRVELPINDDNLRRLARRYRIPVRALRRLRDGDIRGAERIFGGIECIR